MSEQPLPRADAIDASRTGVLVAFAEPAVLARGTRVCCSLSTADGMMHLLGRVRRVERGADFRTYVALSLDEPHDPGDRDRWSAWLRELPDDE